MIKKWKEFFSDIKLNESLNLSLDDLFRSMPAKRLNPGIELKLPEDFNLDINHLEKSDYFFNSLKSLGLERGELFDSTEIETFIRTPFKFFFIYKIPANPIVEPEYLLLQPEGGETQLWRLDIEVKIFLDKISSRTIKLTKGSGNWIYSSSNGNNWKLLNIDKSNDEFRGELDKSDIEKLISDSDINFNIN